MSQKSYDGSPCLYLIPTPIGNMQDITVRTLEVLKKIDILFCEDTRVTNNMLSYFDLKKKLIANHNFNEENNKEKLLSFLQAGKSVGIVSDRGMPIISDPGYILVRHALENGYHVVALPGGSAFLTALVASGLPPLPFTFYGFLNNKQVKRLKELETLKYRKETLLFYEAPHRLLEMLNDMLKVFGDRKISVCREISKKFEEIYRGSITSVLKELGQPRGEFVIIVSGNQGDISFDSLSLKEHILMYMEQGFTQKEAIKKVALDRNQKKSDIYHLYHTIDKDDFE